MEYLFSDKLSNSELNISKVLLDNIDSIDNITITQLSKMAFVSNAAITKYAKKLGFSGYKELKYKLINDSVKKEENVGYIQKHHQKINDFFTTLNINKLEDLAKTIKKSQYICMYGKGPSLGVCKYFSSRIKAVSNIPVLVYEDDQMIDIELENINDNKTIIFLTASLETKEIVDRIKKAKIATKNFYLICEDIKQLERLKEDNIIKLSSSNKHYDYTKIRDRTLFYIYLELLIETLKQE